MMYITSDFKDFCGTAVPMGPDEEQCLLHAAAAGDFSAKEQLVERKLPIVVKAVCEMRTDGILDEDLLQPGVVGLIKALDTYPEHGENGLDEFILSCVRKEIRKFLTPDGGPQKCREVPREADLSKAVERLGEMERRVITMRMGLNGEPGRSQPETAQLLGLSEEEVSRALRRAQNNVKKYL